MSRNCMCCGASEIDARIDFHHWDYQTDIGVHLCRDCHNFVHEGVRARDQSKESPHGEDWRIPTVNRMVGLHENTNGAVKSWDRFLERYNIPKQEPYTTVYDLELL